MDNKTFSPLRTLRTLRRLTMFNKIRNKDEESFNKETSPLLQARTEPKDWFMLTYIILFLHGIGHLLPWNMFITAHEYFEDRFTCPLRHTSNETLVIHNCHDFHDSFESYFSVAAMSSVVVTSALNIYIQSKIHFKYRMFASLVMMLVLFILTAIVVEVDTKKWVNEFFALTLLTIIIMNLFSGLFQSSTFGFAGVLPQKYIAAVMSGQACAGLFSSISRIISIAVVKNQDINLSSLIYFLSAAVVILICLISFFVLLKLDYVRYHLAQTSVRTIKAVQEDTVRGSMNVRVEVRIPFFKIFQKIWVYATSVFLVFAVTLSLFPAVISSIKSTVRDSTNSIWTGSLFDALVCFLLFNSADFVGRYLSNWFKMPGKWKYLLLVFTVLRVLFVLLFLMCNVQPRSEDFIVYFNNDVFPIIVTTIFGLSNGFFASLAMVSAPQCVQPEYRETASIIMTWFLTLGLLVGAAFSFLFVYLIRIDSS